MRRNDGNAADRGNTSSTGMMASKITEAEYLAAKNCSPQALAKAEKAVAELLAERKSAASRAPRLHSGPDIPIGPGESCSRLGGNNKRAAPGGAGADPSFCTTTATTFSPNSSSGSPTTADSFTASCASRTTSISFG